MTTSLRLDAATLRRLLPLQDDTGKSVEALVSELVTEGLAARQGGVEPWFRFTSGLAHELRTPLGSLLMMAELLIENASGHLAEGELKYVRNIEQAGRDLLQVVDDVHTLARLEGQFETLSQGQSDGARPTEVSLGDLLTDLEREFEAAARDKGLALSMTQSSGEPVVLRADRKQLLEILRTLIRNAIRVSDAGNVSVAVDLPAGDSVVFAVSDNGPPISEEHRNVLFAPFQRADARSSRKYGGSGLDLAIARARSRLLGGSLTVMASGEATRLALHLPLHGPRWLP